MSTPHEHLTDEAKAGCEKVAKAMVELVAFVNKQTADWSPEDRIRYTCTMLMNNAVVLTKDIGIDPTHITRMVVETIKAGTVTPPVFSPQDIKPEHRPQ